MPSEQTDTRSLWRRGADAWKAAKINFGVGSGTPWGTGGGQWAGDGWGHAYSTGTPGSKYNYEAAAGQIWKNSAVAPCIAWCQRTYPQAKLRVTKESPDGDEVPIAKHPMVALIERPTLGQTVSGMDLWQRTIFDFLMDGNAFWIKGRGSSGVGGVKELWHRPFWTMFPVWPRDGSQFISGYMYRPNGVPQGIFYPREDVVHFRFGYDPENERRGWSPIRSSLREIATDNEASSYSGAILRNLGVVGGMLSPDDPAITITKPQSDEMNAAFREKFGGDNRGGLMVPTKKMNYTELGRSPQEMALGDIRHVPEDRICAAFGLSAMVIGLTAGGETKTFANFEQATESAFEQNVIPTQQLFASALSLQLLPDFGTQEDVEVGWDYSKIKAMRPDEDAIMVRATTGYRTGVLTLNQALALIGQPPAKGPEGEQRFRPGAGLAKPGANGSASQLFPMDAAANGNGKQPANGA